MDFLAGIYQTAAQDPVGHLGLFIGGILIGIGLSSLYWSVRWRMADKRLDAWEKMDLELKAAMSRWFASRPCREYLEQYLNDQIEQALEEALKK